MVVCIDFVCIYHAADARSSVCLLNKFDFSKIFVLLHNKNSNTTYTYTEDHSVYNQLHS